MDKFEVVSCCSEYTEPSDVLEIGFRDSNGQVCTRQYPLDGDGSGYIACCGPMGAISDIAYFLSHGGSIIYMCYPTNIEFDFEKKEIVL